MISLPHPAGHIITAGGVLGAFEAALLVYSEEVMSMRSSGCGVMGGGYGGVVVGKWLLVTLYGESETGFKGWVNINHSPDEI